MSAERMSQPDLSAGTIFHMPSRVLAALVLVLVASLLPALRSGTGTALPPPAAADWGASVAWAEPDWGRMPLYFIANRGQMDGRVAFYVEGRDKTLYFTAEGVTFALTSAGEGEAVSRWVVKLDFLGANAVQPVGQEQMDAVISYFRGAPGEWHTGLPTYARIVYPNLWPGIDLAYSGTVNRLKYEFVVQPGADPTRIRLAYRGASVQLNEAGQLEVHTPAGSFQDDAPVAYQEVGGVRVPVAVAYALENNTYGFHLGAYDPTVPLVIDPAVLVYCGYIGGSGTDHGDGIAVDAAGNAYVTGRAASSQTTFPTLIGPDITHNGGDDAFVAKVKADGTGLLYCGYIGGSGTDWGTGIDVDSAGNVYVTGVTSSTQATFPVVVGPDLTYNGGSYDAFVAKVKADGTELTYCGYIGGNAQDEGRDIAVDRDGHAYVTGLTYSGHASFPVKTGPDLSFNGGNGDAFIAKVEADGTELAYCGYIGGSDQDYGNRITVDSDNYAYISGVTLSSEATFPVKIGPDLSYNGGDDAFVAKVKADGSGLVYCGYIGGSLLDRGGEIAVDSAGNAYVTGQANSTEATFPVKIGPDLTHNGNGDGFVAKVKADGTELAYCGYIGGSATDWGGDLRIDAAGNVYISGYTTSTEATFPVKAGPDLTYNGSGDAFVAKVKADGTELDYCGYIGGSGQDIGRRIAIDSVGNIYIAGATASAEGTFPVKVGPDLTYNGGNFDAFVVKISHTETMLNLYLPLIVR